MSRTQYAAGGGPPARGGGDASGTDPRLVELNPASALDRIRGYFVGVPNRPYDAAMPRPTENVEVLLAHGNRTPPGPPLSKEPVGQPAFSVRTPDGRPGPMPEPPIL